MPPTTNRRIVMLHTPTHSLRVRCVELCGIKDSVNSFGKHPRHENPAMILIRNWEKLKFLIKNIEIFCFTWLVMLREFWPCLNLCRHKICSRWSCKIVSGAAYNSNKMLCKSFIFYKNFIFCKGLIDWMNFILCNNFNILFQSSHLRTYYIIICY